MYTDLRERTYVMMNNDKVAVRRFGNCNCVEKNKYIEFSSDWELWWPYGNKYARVIQGGQLAAINGFMHQIDNVLLLPQDINAGCDYVSPFNAALLLALFVKFIVR